MEGHPSTQGEDQVIVQPVSQPISPLRQRMLEDMAMRGLREATQRDYVRLVRSFAAFLRRAPDTATPEDIRRFQVYRRLDRSFIAISMQAEAYQRFSRKHIAGIGTIK
jgi:hypothetical protein